MKFENSLASVTTDIKEAMTIIADNMIRIRPRGELTYRPYNKTEVYWDRPAVEHRRLELKKLYPDAAPGNVVYVGTVLDAASECDCRINMHGNAKVIFDGEVIFDYQNAPNKMRFGQCLVHLKKGENPVLFVVRCDDENEFNFEFMPSEPHFCMWAKDYTIHVRATSPIEHFRGEDGVGISRLYTEDDEFVGVYVYPEIGEKSNRICFDKIYQDELGVCAYALTYAQKDATLCISPYSETKVMVNGKEVSDVIFSVRKDDAILVKSLRGDKWGFSFDEDAPIGIPFLKSNRGFGDKWLTLGAFGNEKCMEIPYGPELSLHFDRPYITQNYKKTFWKLGSKNDYIRPYVDTSFFSQWLYSVMVGHFGLLQTAKTVGNNEYLAYFTDSMQNMARFFDYMQYEFEEFGQTTFMSRCIKLDNLDNIGSIGMNMCELYKLISNPEVLDCIEALEKAAKLNIPRFEDGTYCRTADMWTDDTYMSCPFIVRLGHIKNDIKYFEEVVHQLLGYKKRLWMEDKKIFSHIFFLDTQVANRIPWGRGNGWVFYTLSDVLQEMPESTPGRDELMDLYKIFAEGVAQNQDDDGMWHQVLTRPDSYQETSCTAMFIIGMCRGIRNGWLGEEYIPKIKSAYNALISKKIDKNGTVYGVCRGSGNSMDEEYYVNLGTIDDDDHGTGIILTAMAEMAKIFE